MRFDDGFEVFDIFVVDVVDSVQTSAESSAGLTTRSSPVMMRLRMMLTPEVLTMNDVFDEPFGMRVKVLHFNGCQRRTSR